MAYSMPLWTIFEKCPAPTVPAWTKPNSPSGLRVSKTGCTLATCPRVAAAHQGVAVRRVPRRRRRRRSRRTRCPSRRASSACSLVVGPAGVSAVDDEVAVAEQRLELGDGLPGRVAGRNHHPDDLGRRERGDQVLQAVDVAHVGVAVEADDRVTAAAQPLAHVAAHLAQADESDVHGAPSGGGRVRAGGGPSGVSPACAAASAGSGSRDRVLPSALGHAGERRRTARLGHRDVHVRAGDRAAARRAGTTG